MSGPAGASQRGPQAFPSVPARSWRAASGHVSTFLTPGGLSRIVTTMERDPALLEVLARSEAYHGARLALHRAIREAYEAGHSLRVIGAEAQLSHEQVRRLVAQDLSD